MNLSSPSKIYIIIIALVFASPMISLYFSFALPELCLSFFLFFNFTLVCLLTTKQPNFTNLRHMRAAGYQPFGNLVKIGPGRWKYNWINLNLLLSCFPLPETLWSSRALVWPLTPCAPCPIWIMTSPLLWILSLSAVLLFAFQIF